MSLLDLRQIDHIQKTVLEVGKNEINHRCPVLQPQVVMKLSREQA